MDGVFQSRDAVGLVENAGWRETGMLKGNVGNEALVGCTGRIGMREFYSLSRAKSGTGVVAESATRLFRHAYQLYKKGARRWLR